MWFYLFLQFDAKVLSDTFLSFTATAPGTMFWCTKGEDREKAGTSTPLGRRTSYGYIWAGNAADKGAMSWQVPSQLLTPASS